MTLEQYIQFLQFKASKAHALADHYRQSNDELAVYYDRKFARLDVLISELKSLDEVNDINW